MIRYIICVVFLLTSIVSAQETTTKIKGQITSEGQSIAFASIYVKGGTIGVSADENGKYEMTVNSEVTELVAVSQGYRTLTKTISLTPNTITVVDFELIEDALGLNQVVVSATRNRISKKEAPVIVKVLSPKLFNATQSLSLADGLNYQPGVRVETNCQNCGFTQVRMNGLKGQYTQILVNSRPVFSALNGVYGLEQIPVSIIDRVEVVRSGGSDLFVLTAIAGTINVISIESINSS